MKKLLIILLLAASSAFAQKVSLNTQVRGILPVANGGTGTATPGLVAGTNVTVVGTWPNQTIAASGGGSGITLASGTAAMATAAIGSGTCATVVTISAPGVATTDVVTASVVGDPTGVTGYTPATTGMLTIFAYTTTGNVNFKVCNDTLASITPGAITLNWRVGGAFAGLVPVVNGGTGTSSPALVAGTNVTITGNWPNQTINSSGGGGGAGITLASGATALGTSAIASGACATVVTATATGVASTDVVTAGFNADVTGVIGYIPSTNGTLTIYVYPGTNVVNFKVCNNTAAGITPGAVTLNWRVGDAFPGILAIANGGTGVNSPVPFVQTGVDINTSFQVTALHLGVPTLCPAGQAATGITGAGAAAGCWIPAVTPNILNALGDLTFGFDANIPARLSAPQTPTGVTQAMVCTPLISGGCVPRWAVAGTVPNVQTGTSYTILPVDRRRHLRSNNASPVAWTLPQAGTAGYDSNFSFEVCNDGAGTLTITWTNSSGGSSTFVFNTNQCGFIRSDNANYMSIPAGSAAVGVVSSVSAPPQFTVTNPSAAVGITYTALPNNYLEDPKSPYLQNLAIRHLILIQANGNTSFTGTGDGVNNTGTFAFQSAGATLPPAEQVAIANGSAVGSVGNNSGIIRTGRTNGIRATCMIYVGTSLTNVRTGCALRNSSTLAGYFSAAQTANIYAEVIFDQTGAIGGLNDGTPDATHWQLCTGTDGTHQSCASTGVTVVVGTKYILELFEDVANSKWTAFVNGANATDEATNNPASGQGMSWGFGAWGAGAVTGTFDVSMMQITSDW